MHARTLIIPCALFIAAPLLAQDPITGSWKGELTPTGGRMVNVTMALKFDGKSAVTGAVVGFPEPGEVKTGAFDPAKKTLKLHLGPTGGPGMLKLEGTMVSGIMTGTAIGGDGSDGTFILTKVAETAGASGGAQGDAAAAVRGGFTEVSDWVTKAAALVPPDKYTYRPATTVRTVGQMFGHIADSYGYYCSRAAKRNVQWSDAIEKGATDKATLAAKLKQATDACNTVYSGTGNDIGQLMANVAHTSLHYGNLITYIRMLGLTPPSS